MRLGIDIGTNSIGWWLYATDYGQITEIIDGGVRIFSSGRDPKTGTSLAVDRRNARSQRRLRDRYLRRRHALLKELTTVGLMPKDLAEAKELEKFDPYALRAKGLDEELTLTQLGRSLFHLNQRRGFKSNRKTDQRNNESGIIEKASAKLDQEMIKAGARTYGEFLHKRRNAAIDNQKIPPVRVRLRKVTHDNEEKEIEEYSFYADRRHLSEEFSKLWGAQVKYYPEVLTDSLRESIYQIIFYQRPLKASEVGRCLFTDEKRLPKAHPLASRRVLYETVNSLRITAPGQTARRLSKEQRDLVILALDTKNHTKSLSGMKVTLRYIAKVLKLGPDEIFTLETLNRDSISCDSVRASLSHPDRFGNSWVSLSIVEKCRIVEKLQTTEDKAELVKWLMVEHDLNYKIADSIAESPLPEGYSRIGESATKCILNALKSEVCTYNEAVKLCGWHHSDLRTGEILSELPYYGAILDKHVIPGTQNPKNDDITRYGRITNPTVHIGLNQLRRLVNRIISVYGKPDEIVVELARDLKQSQDQKRETLRRIKENSNAAKQRSKKLEELGIPDTGDNRMILRLWEELGNDVLKRKCPYSCKPISVGMLFNGSCDVDHILPYSRTLDDSIANRTFCLREENRSKGNQTPWEAWGKSPRWQEIEANLKNLPTHKQWRFLPDAMKRYDEERDFLDRALVDTQYLSRMANTYLGSLYDGGDGKRHVWVVPGKLTEMLRRHWGLNSLLPDHNRGAEKGKNRTDHRHHAIDAAVIAATDRGLVKQISDAARNNEIEGVERVARSIDPPWKGFRSDILAQLERIIVSHRVDHGRIDPSARRDGLDSTAGRLHNDTAYGLTGKTQNGVPMVVTRKPLKDLRLRMLDMIRDTYLRRCLETAIMGKDDSEFSQTLIEFAKHPGPYAGIRRVRLIEPVSVIEISDSAGSPYKGYKPNSNYCYEVWQLPNGRWVPQVVTVFEAHQTRMPLKPHPAAKRIMRLHKKDTVFLSHPKYGDLKCIVQKFTPQRLELVPHNEANADARNRDKTDPFSFIGVGIRVLQKSRAHRVTVNEMGMVRD